MNQPAAADVESSPGEPNKIPTCYAQHWEDVPEAGAQERDAHVCPDLLRT